MSKKTINYDPSLIQEAANRLYSAAASIIFTSTFFGLIIGTVIGGAIYYFVKPTHPDPGIIILIGALLGGIFGYSSGRERAFRLKLEAQKALCQVQIEKNTRIHTNEEV